MTNTSSHLLHFETALNWLSGDRGILHAQHISGPIYVSTPKEFKGSGKDWSPEHLFLGSMASCFMSTFLFFAKQMHLYFNHMECRVSGEVNFINGKYQFTKINFYPTVFVNADIERSAVDAVLDKTKEHCLVSITLSVPTEYHVEVKSQVLLEETNGQTDLADGRR
ncbi:MAG TPA: OsmC family protein [Chitinophagaceae bacterium]|nr:OsmC family protein [Chitinophagaceae bacterium]